MRNRFNPGLFGKISYHTTPSVHFFSLLDTETEKLMGATGAYKNQKNPSFLLFEFGLGTPLPLETSAVLSQIGDEEKRVERLRVES